MSTMIENLKRLMIEHNEKEYYDIITNFTFAGNLYEGPVNFAYLNSRVDQILRENNIDYDESWMFTEKMTYKISSSKLDEIVLKLHNQGVDKLVADNVISELVSLYVELVHLIDSGKRASLDVCLTGIIKDTIEREDVRELLLTDHINDKMTPEEILMKKEEILVKLETMDIYGVSELLRSGSGAKANQVFDCLIGLWLRTRIQNMNDVAPVIIKDRWIDGVSTRESHFIESNNNRQAAIVSKQTIKDSGKENKQASILAQDNFINGVDCGSINGLEITVNNARDLKSLKYKYMMTPEGLYEITEKDTNLIGKKILIRSILTCANRSGVCGTCFGSHYKWSMHTKEYRRDLGSEFTKDEVGPASQDVLSFKHTITPTLVPILFTIEEVSTGEAIEDYKTLFTREFNKIILNKGVSAYFKLKDLTNKTYQNSHKKEAAHILGNIKYLDSEYGEYDIIRVKRIYMRYKNREYKVEVKGVLDKNYTDHRHVDFKLKGFPNFNTTNYDPNVPIEIKDTIMHVIPNRSKTDRFINMKALYNSSSIVKPNSNTMLVRSIEELVVKAKRAMPNAHISSIEVLFRNKVKDKYDNKKRVDWTKPDAKDNYVILSELTALHALSSLSAKLGLGYFAKRIKDPYYYDPSNITPSSYDLLLDDMDEIIQKDQYEYAEYE